MIELDTLQCAEHCAVDVYRSNGRLANDDITRLCKHTFDFTYIATSAPPRPQPPQELAIK